MLFFLENLDNYPENKFFFFSTAIISIRFKNLLATLHQHFSGRHFFYLSLLLVKKESIIVVVFLTLQAIS